MLDPRTFLRELFDRAVEVADPMQSLARFLPDPRPERVTVIGAGKASARMAEAVEEVWGPCEGLVITRDGYARPCKGIEIVEAAHPVPDARGAAATARMLKMVAGLGEQDFVLTLISGGASSLLVAPAAGITLDDKRAVTEALLASGARIGEINIVRKHLSAVKGGQLAAAAHPARMLTLMLSDVPGDDPAAIGSGPTVGDRSDAAAAREIVERCGIALPPSVAAALDRPSGVLPPDHRLLSRVENTIFAGPAQSLAEVSRMAEAAGVEVRLLGDAIEGEAREVAAEQAELALSIRAERGHGGRPVLLLSGGELTVKRRGRGTGGPNAEFCLALAVALKGAQGIHALACDTDGVDGGAEVAGALIGPDTLARAAALGVDPRAALDDNDAHGFFGRVRDQVVTGPTLTNVNDFRAVLIGV